MIDKDAQIKIKTMHNFGRVVAHNEGLDKRFGPLLQAMVNYGFLLGGIDAKQEADPCFWGQQFGDWMMREYTPAAYEIRKMVDTENKQKEAIIEAYNALVDFVPDN